MNCTTPHPDIEIVKQITQAHFFNPQFYPKARKLRQNQSCNKTDKKNTILSKNSLLTNDCCPFPFIYHILSKLIQHLTLFTPIFTINSDNTHKTELKTAEIAINSEFTKNGVCLKRRVYPSSIILHEQALACL